MSLTLTIISYQRLSPGQESVKVIDCCNASIGRAAGNDWVLPDPDRVISGKHCTIQYQDNNYFLTDTSTNGVFINQSEQRVGRGQTVQLHDGDELNLGEYEIQVSISQPEISPAETPSYSTPDEEGTDLLLAPPDGGAINPPAADLLDDPFANVPDPFSASSTPLIPEDVDLLGLDNPDPLSWSQSGELDHIPPEEEIMQPLDAIPATNVPSDGELIPDDWNAAWNKPSPELAKPPPEAPEALLPEQFTQPTPPVPQPPPQATPQPPPQATPQPPPQATPQPPPQATPQPMAPRQSAPLQQLHQPPSAPPAPDRGAHEQRPAPPSRDERVALQAFLSGAGLSQLAVSETDIPQFMNLAGQMLRQSVQGLIETLRARQQTKSEFRLQQTTIQPAANNPLKFTLNAEEAVAILLSKKHSAYLPPVQAIEQGFADIEAHQLAMMAGMQAALDKLLDRFNPKVLETRLGQHSVLDNILPANRKAKYWDLFNALYSEIAREAEDDFHELFGKEFARAYEEQIRKL